MYEGTEENLAEQLALELDEDDDNVKMTLAFLQANKLIEQLSEDEYLLNKVPESIGSETGAAERMRKMREKRNIVTPELHPVTKSYTEIEIRDKRKELETDKDYNNDGDYSKIVQAFQNNGFGLINQGTKDKLVDLIETYSSSWTLDAIDIAVTNNKRNLAYVGGILRKWKAEGKNNGQSNPGSNKSSEEEVDWAERAGIQSF